LGLVAETAAAHKPPLGQLGYGLGGRVVGRGRLLDG